MKKNALKSKLSFKKQLIANLNQEASSQILGGAANETIPLSSINLCVPDLKSTSTGCYTCECDKE